MGEVSTDIFLLGIHRDPGKGPSDLPLFLVECRRRFFAAAYQLDKSIATFLGRPPRLPWRHSDCKLPLDISDEALVYEKSLPGLAQNTLGIDGWDVNGVRQRASWVRVRFLISIFREEILDLSHQTPSLEMAEKLKYAAHPTFRFVLTRSDISRRCHSAWDSIPAHLRYTPQPWNDNLPLGESIMLIISYLAYHYNDFLIQRLLVQQDPDATSALLSVSSTILSAVLVLGAQREIVNGIYSDFTWTVSFPYILTHAEQTRSFYTVSRQRAC